MIKLSLAILLVLSVFSSHATEALSLQVSTQQPSFVVSLDANPTTGYQWSLVNYDNKTFTLTNSVYQKPNTKLIGAGGKMVYTFGLIKGKHYPENTTMLFKYARSWEPNSAMLKKVNITFVN